MQFLTVKELSERWRLGRKSIERLVSRGEIQPTRIGRSIRFSLAEVERYEKRQSGDQDPIDAAQERLDAALASVGDKLAGMDGPAGTSSWSRREASKYRSLLGRLEMLDESGLDKLAKLAREHGVDDSHLELHAIAVRMHSVAQLIAAELAERQSALNAMTESSYVLGGGCNEAVLQQQTEARNRVTESHNAARIVSYLGCIYPWLLGAAPSHVLEPRLGLIAPLLSRAAELGLKDELLASLTGETSDDATDEPDGTPAVPWWQCRKVPGAGGKSQPLQERAMTL